MEGIILNHYPPVIKQIREIQQIARAEDIEFSKLKTLISEVINNMFVYKANETGVTRFEKILGIMPKAAQSLEERKLFIISMMNRRKMSLSELMAMLSGYSEGIELINDISKTEMTVIINSDAGSIDVLNKIIDEILPLNIYFEFSLQRETTIKYKIEEAVFMTFESAAGETEYCNFDNNITQIEKADYSQKVAGFSFMNSFHAAGQMICGIDLNLTTPAHFEMRESKIDIQQNQTQAANTFKMCGTDYTREEA